MYYEGSDTIEAHSADKWFNPSTMRGHGTRVHYTAFSGDGIMYFLPFSNAYPAGRLYGVACFRKDTTLGVKFHHVYRSDLSQPALRTMKAAVALAQELAT